MRRGMSVAGIEGGFPVGVPQQAQHPGGQLTHEELGVGGPQTMSVRGARPQDPRRTVRRSASSRHRTAAGPLGGLRPAVLAAALSLALGGWAIASQDSSAQAPLVLATVPPTDADGAGPVNAERHRASPTVVSGPTPTPAPILRSVWAATRWEPTTAPAVVKASAAVPKFDRDLSAAAPRPGYPHSRVPA